MTDIPIKIQFVKTLHNAKPSRIIAVKADGDTNFSLYVTDKNGLPYPIKDESGTNGITNITSSGGTIAITGNSTTKNLEIDSSILTLINSAVQAGDNISVLINDANYITLADIPSFSPSDYDLEDFTNNGADPFAHISEITDGITNLGYAASPTNGVITSDTGNDATIPLADGTNAGLLKPSKFTVLESTSGTNTGDQDLSGLAIDINVVHKTGNESVSGVKTFTNDVIATNFKGTSMTNANGDITFTKQLVAKVDGSFGVEDKKETCFDPIIIETRILVNLYATTLSCIGDRAIFTTQGTISPNPNRRDITMTTGTVSGVVGVRDIDGGLGVNTTNVSFFKFSFRDITNSSFGLAGYASGSGGYPSSFGTNYIAFGFTNGTHTNFQIQYRNTSNVLTFIDTGFILSTNVFSVKFVKQGTTITVYVYNENTGTIFTTQVTSTFFTNNQSSEAVCVGNGTSGVAVPITFHTFINKAYSPI
jgi:hypothetical protein